MQTAVAASSGGAGSPADIPSRSTETGHATAGFSALRDRKNEVDMMSNCQPSFRAMASALGTFGDSMKP